MAEFDLNELINSSRVKFFLDLSKVFPSKAFIYLAALLPGLFFEISVLLANPELVRRIAVQQTFVTNQYVTIAIFVFLAFVVGNAFMLVVMFIQFVFGYLYRFWSFCWKQFCKWPLKPILDWLLKKPSLARHRSLIEFYRYVLDRGYLSPTEWQKLWHCWMVFARRLVSTRYGIKEEELKSGDWEILYWTLGSPTQEETRGDVMMIASHSMGWAGLSASQIAPALGNRYYIALCIFLIFNGLLHDYYLTKRRVDPRISGYTNVRAILREFPENLTDKKRDDPG